MMEAAALLLPCPGGGEQAEFYTLNRVWWPQASVPFPFPLILQRCLISRCEIAS